MSADIDYVCAKADSSVIDQYWTTFKIDLHLNPKEHLNHETTFFQLKIEAEKYLVVFLIDSGVNLDISVQINWLCHIPL